MGVASVLSKKKLAIGMILAGVVIGLSGCKDTVVNYQDFLEKPTARRNADKIEIVLGYTAASANWIAPVVRIENDQILVAGTLTFEEKQGSITVQLPNSKLKYQVYWVDKDGTKHEMPVQQ